MRSGTPRQAAEAGVRAAVRALATGRMVVVADDREREDEGNLVAAAALMSAEQMAFFLRHGSGIVCAPMSDERANELELPLMVDQNTESHGTAFTISVDHRSVGTGISAADRAETVRALASPGTRAADLRRPGHVFPLRARPGGVLRRTGHTEAATDLVRLAGMADVGVITELVGDNGVPLSGEQTRTFADAQGLPFLRIAEPGPGTPVQQPPGDLHRAGPVPAGRRGVHYPLLHLGAQRGRASRADAG